MFKDRRSLERVLTPAVKVSPTFRLTSLTVSLPLDLLNRFAFFSHAAHLLHLQQSFGMVLLDGEEEEVVVVEDDEESFEKRDKISVGMGGVGAAPTTTTTQRRLRSAHTHVQHVRFAHNTLLPQTHQLFPA